MEFRRVLFRSAACSWMRAVLSFSIFDVPSMMFAVVVLSAVICSSTSFWFVIACATVIAVLSAPTVVVEARSTPFTSSTLFLDRKRVVEGKRVSVRVDLGGRRNLKKKKQQ